MAKRPDPSLQARSQLLHQRLTECLEIADRAYILQTGRVVLARAAGDIARDTDMRRIHLGL